MKDERITRRELIEKMGKLGLVTAGAMAFPGLLAACSTGASGTGPIKIGCLTDLTGVFTVYGEQIGNNVQMAIDEINANGGLLGRKLQYIVEDGASDTKVYVQKAKKLVEDHKVDFVVGAITSPERDAMAGPVADRGKTLYAYPELYEGGEDNANILCAGAVPQQQVIPFAPWLIENFGKKFYLVGADYEWPHKTSKVIKEAVEQNGGEILGEEYMPFTATDFSAVIQRIKDSGADVIWNNYNGGNYVNFLKQLNSFGINARNTGIATNFIGDLELPALPKEIAEGLVVCKEYFVPVDTEENRKYLKKYRDGFGKDKIPSSTGVNSYNAVRLYAEAVKKAESTDTEKVKKAMADIKITTPTGELQLAEGQNHTKLHMYIAQCENTEYKIVKDLGYIEPDQKPVWS